MSEPMKPVPPTVEDAWASYKADAHAYFVPRVEYESIMSRLARADRIEAAAGAVVKGWDEKDTMAIMLAIRDHLIPAFSSDNTVDDAGRGSNGSTLVRHPGFAGWRSHPSQLLRTEV